jgi:hypothetical protein
MIVSMLYLEKNVYKILMKKYEFYEIKFLEFFALDYVHHTSFSWVLYLLVNFTFQNKFNILNKIKD